MCARRFLILILVLTLLVVAAAFAIFQFGNCVLIKSAIPRGHFEAAQAGSGTDYAELDGWIARPGLGEDLSRWVPQGFEAAPAPATAAVFYVHPTTYLERDRWNAPLRPGGDTELRSRLFVRSQASALAGAGEIWAPRYRQAAFGAFLLSSKDADAALDLAYSDVAAAFDRFAAETGERPLVLAGHSQGALHLERLLREKVAGKPIARRIATVYAAGWPISAAADLPALGLPACRSAAEAGCILSWMSFAEPANPELLLHQWERTEGPAGGKRRREDILCVNPLTGTRGSSAPPQANPGTLVPTADLTGATLLPGRVGARCGDGLLLLEGEIPPLGPYVLPGNNYHVYDYALFWAAMRRDAERRVSAWRG